MEIHPPHGAVHSIKDFLLHLSIVVAGILIALTLDGLLEWTHHRQVVREAEANLASEISDNRRSLRENLASIRKSREQLEKMLSQVAELEQNRNAPVHHMEYSWHVMTLNSTSWNSAISANAVSYMEYSKVKQYTEIYDGQNLYLDVQRQSFQSWTPVGGILAAVVVQKDFKKVKDAQLLELERAAGIAMMNAQVLEDAGKALDSQYTSFLGK